MLIMEDNPPARRLILAVQNFNQNQKLTATLDDKAKKLLPLKHIREDILFQPKKSSSPLELADFCAFIWKRFLQDQTDERFLQFFNPMRSQIVSFSLGTFS